MSGTDLSRSEGMDDWSHKMRDIMDEMRNRSFCGYRASGAWQPTINIYENRVALCICVELAGLDRDSVSVRCADSRHICIGGRRARPRASQMEEPYSVELMEIDEGDFLREVELQHDVKSDAVKIAYEEGYLWITLPRITEK